MFLAAGEFRTALSHFCLYAVFQNTQKFRYLGLFRHLHYLCFRGVRITDFDIVVDGVIKEIDILKYLADQAVNGLRRHIFEIYTANGYPPFLHIPEPGNEVGDGCFPGT